VETNQKNGLSGKVALVTGGGRGLGEATSRVLARAGAIVVIADVREELAERAAQSIVREGGAATALALDVRDEGQAEEAVRTAVAEHGALDILINNAAVDMTVSVEELSVQDWDRILAVNLRGPFVMAKHAFPIMKQKGSGHIINIASTASKRAWANASAYHASKWGLVGFSHALHVEARQHGVKVTAIVCGGMRTPFLLERFPDIDQGTLQDPRNVAETIKFVLCQPAETVIPEVMVLPMKETSWP
jgi:NAD(P)-dependent dehydrogenase (short-subunit alcohol dehydrogenase family)